jgi:hypothetical protein
MESAREGVTALAKPSVRETVKKNDKRARLTPEGVPEALRNCILLSQQCPTNYRWFGIYWWHVQARLKRAGFLTKHLYSLGSYVDPFTAAMVPPGGEPNVLEGAFREYGCNTRHRHICG